jgi:segregation and condensation protein A
MAAMLMEIKSRMRLPRPKHAADDGLDPRAELVRRLLEYEQMKLAAQRLDELPQRDRDFRPVEVWIEQSLVARLPDVHVQDLENAWRSLLARARLSRHHRVTRDELSVREHMTQILRLLGDGAFRAFGELFEPWRGVSVLVVNFLAVLELAREGLIRVTQAAPYAPIYVQLAGGEGPAPEAANEGPAPAVPDAGPDAAPDVSA